MIKSIFGNKEVFGRERSNLKWIEIGSQAMSLDEKNDLLELFPNALIIQHYGLTEASRATLLKFNALNQVQLGSVGEAGRDVSIRVNEKGIICIKGENLASGLLIEGEVEPINKVDGWFVTSDLGRIEDGFLFYEGRVDSIINCGGQSISSDLIQAELMLELDIAEGICVVRIPDKIYGEVALLVKKEGSVLKSALCTAMTKIMSKNGINSSNAFRYMEVDEIPVTETGKVQINMLTELYLLTQKDENAVNKKVLGENKTTLEKLILLYQEKLGGGIEISPGDSVDTLGFDSISVVMLSLPLERILGCIPLNFRTLTILELSKLKEIPSESGSNSNHSIELLGTCNENPKGLPFWILIKEDFKTHESDFFSQGFWAIFNNRFGNWRMDIKSKIFRAPCTLLYLMHRKLIQVLCGIKLDYTVALGRRVKLEHFGGMIIGARSIGDDVTIRQNTTFGIKNLSNLSGKPSIERGVNIGAGAVIVGDILVGRYSVIGPNSVVDKDIPPFSTVFAAPSIIETAIENE